MTEYRPNADERIFRGGIKTEGEKKKERKKERTTDCLARERERDREGLLNHGSGTYVCEGVCDTLCSM